MINVDVLIEKTKCHIPKFVNDSYKLKNKIISVKQLMYFVLKQLTPYKHKKSIVQKTKIMWKKNLWFLYF